MAHYYSGEALHTSFTLSDDANAPITGLTAADFDQLEAYLLPGATATADVTLTEIGGGEYAAGFTPTASGTWVLHLRYDAGGVWRDGREEWLVEAAPTAPVGTVVSGGVSRGQLRRDILSGLGDLIRLTATADGTDVTFVDSLNLGGEPGAYRRWEVLFTGGTAANIGVVRSVEGSSREYRSIGFGIALPAATMAGDTAELVNLRSAGFRIQDVHDAINKAIRDARGFALVPVATTSATFVRGEGLVVPADFATVEGVSFQDWDDDLTWHQAAAAKKRDGYGWWVDPATRTVVLGGSFAENVEGQTVRIEGLAEPAELDSDNDVTGVAAEWLVVQAQANLAIARHLRTPNREIERPAFLLEQKARALRPLLMTRRSPFSVTL